MVEYSSFDDILAGQSNKSGEQESQLGRQGIDFETLPIYNSQFLTVANVRIRETKQQVSVGFVVGHATYGVVGVSEVGPLVSPIVTTGVTNQANKFPEIFTNDRFIDDTLSTGSWNDTSEEYLLGIGSELITEEVVLSPGRVMQNFRLNITSDDINTELEATIAIGSYTKTISSFGAWENISDNISDSGTIITFENTSTGSDIIVSDFTFEYTFNEDFCYKELWKEYITDETYYDSSSSSNVTWDTTNQFIDLGSNSELYTETVVEDKCYNKVRLTIPDMAYLKDLQSRFLAYFPFDGNLTDATGNETLTSTGTIAYDTGHIGSSINVTNGNYPAFSPVMVTERKWSFGMWKNFDDWGNDASWATGPRGDLANHFLIVDTDGSHGEIGEIGWYASDELVSDDRFKKSGRLITEWSGWHWVYIEHENNSGTYDGECRMWVDRELITTIPWGGWDTNGVDTPLSHTTGIQSFGEADELFFMNGFLTPSERELMYKSGVGRAYTEISGADSTNVTIDIKDTISGIWDTLAEEVWQDLNGTAEDVKLRIIYTGSDNVILSNTSVRPAIRLEFITV